MEEAAFDSCVPIKLQNCTKILFIFIQLIPEYREGVFFCRTFKFKISTEQYPTFFNNHILHLLNHSKMHRKKLQTLTTIKLGSIYIHKNVNVT